jgi:hypothetical protein
MWSELGYLVQCHCTTAFFRNFDWNQIRFAHCCTTVEIRHETGIDLQRSSMDETDLARWFRRLAQREVYRAKRNVGPHVLGQVTSGIVWNDA